MEDLIFIGLAVIFFGLTGLLVNFCDRL